MLYGNVEKWAVGKNGILWALNTTKGNRILMYEKELETRKVRIKR